MKINKQKNTTTRKILALSIVVVLLLGGLAAYLLLARQNKPQTNSAESSKDVISSSDTADTVSENSNDKESTPNTDVAPPITTNSQGKSSVQMTVSANTSNGNVYIRGGINNAVVTDGVCRAELSGPNGANLQKETSLLQNPSTTDCKTITIPNSELTAGTWTVKLHYTSNTMEGTSNEVSFEV